MKLPEVKWRRLAELLLGVAASTLLFWLYSRVELPWALLGWVGLVPWLLVLDRARSWQEALGAGLAFSVGFSVAIFGWFATALGGYSGTPAWMTWLVLLTLAPVLLQPQFVTFALARYVARRAPGATVGGLAFWRAALTGAFVYVATEWLWPKLFADTLGQGLHASVSLRQGADLAGAHGLTFVLVLANECVLAAGRALWGRREARRALAPAGVFAALVLGLLGYGSLRLEQLRARQTQAPALSVGVVQANITNYARLAAEKGMFDAVQDILDTHFQLSEALLRGAAKPDLLIWPETVYPTTFGTPKSEAGEEFDNAIVGFVAQSGVPLIFGAYELEQEREFNAAMFLEPPREGMQLVLTAYRKTLLFPLTEWVPEAIDSPWLRERLPWLGSWKRGPGPQAVRLGLSDGRSLTVAPLICYEALFTDYVAREVRQGAELLVTLSNDSWFSRTPAPRLHLLVAAFRSIETRRPQVRVTNSGISALITPTGDIVEEIADDSRDSRTLTVPRAPEVRTLVVAWGDWLGPTALVLGTVLLAWAVLAARRRGLPAEGRPGA